MNQCPNCGNPIKPGDKFCNKCSTNLTGNAQQPAVVKKGFLSRWYGKVVLGIGIVLALFIIIGIIGSISSVSQNGKQVSSINNPKTDTGAAAKGNGGQVTSPSAPSADKNTSNSGESKDAKPSAQESTPTTSNPPAKTEPASGVSYENFMKINMGAKLEDVNALLGEGQEATSSEVGGIKTAMYTWNGPGISNMNVTVQNGAVIGKAQMGLKDMDAKVTMDKYNQIKNGMTYDQVKAILGEGQLVSQTKIMDTELSIYGWTNFGGSNMNLTFQGGKVEAKAQFGLK